MDEHLEAPKTSENERENVFCPVTQELTYIGIGHSADGMEAYACMACYEPEPVLREVTPGALLAVYNQFHRNQ